MHLEIGRRRDFLRNGQLDSLGQIIGNVHGERRISSQNVVEMVLNHRLQEMNRVVQIRRVAVDIVENDP